MTSDLTRAPPARPAPPPTVVELFESEKDLKEGRRRRAYPELDVVYFFREDEEDRAVDIICRDFRVPRPPDTRDCFEKLFPCIFRGIPAASGALPPTRASEWASPTHPPPNAVVCVPSRAVCPL